MATISKEDLSARIDALDFKKILPRGFWDRRAIPNEQATKIMLKRRVDTLWGTFGEQAIDQFVRSYEQGFEHQRFYSGQIWQLGTVFIPLSLGAAAYAWITFTELHKIVVAFVAAFLVYFFWYCHYRRLDGLVRANRYYLLIVEELIGQSWYTFTRLSRKTHCRDGIKTIWVVFTYIYAAVLVAALAAKKWHWA